MRCSRRIATPEIGVRFNRRYPPPLFWVFFFPPPRRNFFLPHNFLALFVSEILTMQNKVGLLLAILFILSTASQAQQQAPLITNIEGRHTIDLNGRWQTIIDPYETGYYDYRYQPSTDGYFKNAKPKKPERFDRI